MASRAGWSSFVLRVVFCIVLLMHIPYIFHPLKEAVLVFNQEFNSRTISEGLEQKIREARQKKHDLREEEAEPLKQEDGEPLHLETDISYSLDTVLNASQIGVDSEVTDLTYFTYALACHVLVVILAASIEDISIIFDFISAFGITLLMYILPAVFFLFTSAKFRRKSERN